MHRFDCLDRLFCLGYAAVDLSDSALGWISGYHVLGFLNMPSAVHLLLLSSIRVS